MSVTLFYRYLLNYIVDWLLLSKIQKFRRKNSKQEINFNFRKFSHIKATYLKINQLYFNSLLKYSVVLFYSQKIKENGIAIPVLFFHKRKR